MYEMDFTVHYPRYADVAPQIILKYPLAWQLVRVYRDRLEVAGLARSPKPGDPAEDIRTAIGKRFGSLDRWIEDFKVCCMAANGWGMLVRDIANGRLYNVSSDLHEVGVVWLGQPLVVCDVYEHAFYVDYTNRKQEYVGKFVQFLDWAEIDGRYQALAS